MTELNDVNIRHFKLSTGEELIAIVLDQAELEDSDRSSILMALQRPMKIRTVEQEHSISFLFYEWQPLAKTDVCFINPTHVISHVECDNSVKEQYINVCVNGDPQPPAEPMDSESTDLDSELDNLSFDPSSNNKTTYH
jgi:hypothetical protein